MKFTKMHGAGNDFLLFDGRDDADLERTLPRLVTRLCHRRFGVGADGVLLVTPIAGAGAVRLAYWNADGSRAMFCANGARCAARFVHVRWPEQPSVLVTDHAPVPFEVVGDRVTLHLPAPSATHGRSRFRVGTEDVVAFRATLGVPHLVVPVEWPDFWQRPLAPLAPALRSHPSLPDGGANVNFLRVSPHGLDLRSWERGVEGETLSCGSGAAAAALFAVAEGWSAAPVGIRTASGRILEVRPEGVAPACPLALSGPAEWVADGEVSGDLLATSL